MKFTEDSRVKIPSILHLTRLGYNYLSLRDAVWDDGSNIFTGIFKQSLCKIKGIVDPESLCKDVSGLGRWGNGDVEVSLFSHEQFDDVMGLIQQAFDAQND